MSEPRLTVVAYAIEEAEFLADQTGRRHSLVIVEDGMIAVMETSAAREAGAQILETISPGKARK